MSVQVLRIILLIAVAVCVKIMYKCKIASPGKTAAWIILFPSALFLIDYAALFVFRGMASNAELLSAVYAVGTAITVAVLMVCCVRKRPVAEEIGE